MGLFKSFVSQTRKPEGFLGKMMLNGMNSGHAEIADWGFSHGVVKNRDGSETILFEDGKSYTVTIEAFGYPTVSFPFAK